VTAENTAYLEVARSNNIAYPARNEEVHSRAVRHRSLPRLRWLTRCVRRRPTLSGVFCRTWNARDGARCLFAEVLKDALQISEGLLCFCDLFLKWLASRLILVPQPQTKLLYDFTHRMLFFVL
jgi:hypothetical protein